MATLIVTAPFTVQLDPVPPPDPAVPPVAGARTASDPTTYVFPAAGTYEDVPDEVATHWYTLTFLEGYEAPDASDPVILAPTPPPPEGEGTPAAEGTSRHRHRAAKEE
jgi:hypothetical protein